MNLDDIAVVVFTSTLNLRERALSVERTWLSAFKKGYLISGFHKDPELKAISLGPDVGEDYQSANKKQFYGLKAVFDRHPEAAWFFITGCDAFLFPENLLPLLSTYDPEQDWFIGGHCGQVLVNGESLVYPGGGPGFALSRALTRKLLPHVEAIVQEWEGSQTVLKPSCDVALAYYLRKLFGISVTFVEGFYHCPPYYYPQNTYKNGLGQDMNTFVIDKPLAFHSLSIREMYALKKRGRVEKPTLSDKVFDKISLWLTRRLKTKRIVNGLARFLYG